ncbi:MAG TPA: hypothetical protein DCO79_08475 [Spirochaeta sp.]|nr:hypothetical protein [Spirochaeta sp.]
MISLYRRAENLRREARLLRLIRHEDVPNENDFDISPHDGEVILNELDEIVIRKKIKIDKNTFAFKPLKNDRRFPVLVNFIILFLVFSGIFLFARISGMKEASITSDSGDFLSTEGRLIEKLKMESEAELSAKDDEIAETVKKLDEINKERNLLKLEMDTRIQQREDELQKELSIVLETERSKMQKQGFTSVDIEEQLKQMELDKGREYEQLLASFVITTEEEMEQKDDNLIRIRTEYETLLRTKESEQLALQNELGIREEELLRQIQLQTLEREAAELSESNVSEDFAALTKQKEEEQLIRSQVQTFYRQIEIALKNTDYTAALLKLTTLEEFVTRDSVASLPAVKDSIQIDLFIIKSLTQLIRNKDIPTDNSEVLLTGVSGTIAAADELLKAGDTDGATSLYLEAFSKIPVLRSSYDKLKIINDQTYTEDRQLLIRQIEQTEEQLRTARQEIDRYRAEIAGFNKTEEQLQELIDSRGDLIKRIERAKTAAEQNISNTAEASSQEDLLALLQAKLLMKQILNSESVTTEYPDLYENVENYFAAFAEEKRFEGEYTTLRDVIAFITILSSSDIAPDIGVSQNKENYQLIQVLYSELLDKLKSLIESTS